MFSIKAFYLVVLIIYHFIFLPEDIIIINERDIMDFSYINNIKFPACLIDASKQSIIFINDKARKIFKIDLQCKYSYPQEIINIAELVIKRIGKNDAATFSHTMVIEKVTYDIKLRSQYVDSDRNYVLAIIYIDMKNYISPLDLSLFAEIVPGGLMLAEVTKDKRYILRYVNSTILNMLGYNRKEYEENFYSNISKFINLEERICSCEESILATKTFCLNSRLTCKNGTLIWVSVNGKLIRDLMGREWIYCFITDITQMQELLEKTYEERQVYTVLEKVSKDILFKYDITSEIFRFYGFPLKCIFGKGFVEYSKTDMLEGKTHFRYNFSEMKSFFSNIKKGISIPKTYMAYDSNNTPIWLHIKYDFIYDKQKNIVSVMGQIEDVTSQMQAKMYYDKAITLWSKKEDCDTQIAINLTENIVVDGRSFLFENKQLLGISLEEYFSKVFSIMIKDCEKEKMKRILTRKSLIKSFLNNDKHHQFDLEINFNSQYEWMRIDIDLVENPLTNSIIALIKWKNVNDIQLQKKIHSLLLADSYDFIFCIFSKTDSYMMIQDVENNKLMTNSVVCGYERFINRNIERYADEKEFDYLKFCFSIENLISQLKIKSSYTFIINSEYPNNKPSKKLNYFTYLDKNSGIILYAQKDITDQDQRFSFKMKGTVYYFDYSEILYIESFGRKCQITTIKDVFMVNENISSIQERLPSKIFTKCHRSYIINNSSVIKIEKNYASLTNGKEVPLNKKSMEFIRNKLIST